MKNKYLNKKFNGWKVTTAEKLITGHTSYLMEKKLGEKTAVVRASDNDMTALSRGKTVEALLVSKLSAKR